ncbi:FliM/FliN family flagellar motor switch protein [Jannaschia sp. LMIT008]|uniref:FliM/FliN family flagellar motor switch protein n=1 Tax=Jannaschia maritima TaxID=3032585 RepID=UPI002810A8C1|nr:FliM/FliN family flagellar motor switch protein [Jannaschia sp. LMIT008]
MIAPRPFVPPPADGPVTDEGGVAALNAALVPVAPAGLTLGGREVTVRPVRAGGVPARDRVAVAVLRDGVAAGLRIEMPAALAVDVPGAVLPGVAASGADPVALALELLFEAALTKLDEGVPGRLELVVALSPVGDARQATRAFEVREGPLVHRVEVYAEAEGLPLLAKAMAMLPRAAMTGPTVRPTVRIGAIRVPAARLVRLGAGSVLLPASGSLEMRRGQLTLGRRAGVVTIEGDLATMEDVMTELSEPSRPPSATGGALDFEFHLPGRPATLAELSALGPGCVVPLEIDVARPRVEIRVAGVPWGVGEIVAVGDRLAVQILERADGN